MSVMQKLEFAEQDAPQPSPCTTRVCYAKVRLCRTEQRARFRVQVGNLVREIVGTTIAIAIVTLVIGYCDRKMTPGTGSPTKDASIDGHNDGLRAGFKNKSHKQLRGGNWQSKEKSKSTCLVLSCPAGLHRQLAYLMSDHRSKAPLA